MGAVPGLQREGGRCGEQGGGSPAPAAPAAGRGAKQRQHALQRAPLGAPPQPPKSSGAFRGQCLSGGCCVRASTGQS